MFTWQYVQDDLGCDPTYLLFKDGKQTAFNVQDASWYGGDFVVNLCIFANDILAEMEEHTTHKTLAEAKAAAIALFTKLASQKRSA